jgi:hypothetical protein
MEMALPIERPGLLDRVKQYILSDFESKVEEWADLRRALVDWEDQNGLLDNPTPEKLREHREILDLLGFYGQIFSLASSHPEFPRSEIAETVKTVNDLLRDHYLMFHAPKMDPKKAEEIIATCFPDEPRA